MTLKVYFMSQPSAQKFNPLDHESGRWALLSITDPDCDKPVFEFKDQFTAIKELEFLDAVDGPKTVSYVQAYDMAQFVQAQLTAGVNVAIHCFMGASRSAAVAQWVSQYTRTHNLKHYVGANKLVLTHLNRFGNENFTAFRDVEVFKHPEQTGTEFTKCWECFGAGCDQCVDTGKVRKIVFD